MTFRFLRQFLRQNHRILPSGKWSHPFFPESLRAQAGLFLEGL